MKKLYFILILITIGITQIYAQCTSCDYAFKIGTGTSATANQNTFAGGYYSDASGLNAFAFGNYSTVNGANGIALGNYANVNAANSIAIGRYVTSNAPYSYVFGMGTSSLLPLTNSKQNSIMFGVSDKPTLTIFKPQTADRGYLGIGTDDPKEQVHVVGKLLIENTNGISSSLQFKHPHNAKGISPDPGDLTPYYWDIYSTSTGLYFLTISEIAASQRMVITRNGNVGIGISDPKAKLDVAGRFKATSAVIAEDISASGNVYANELIGETATINGAVTAKTLSAQSADITGALSAKSAIISGALSAQSASITNALTAGSATISGALSTQSASITNALTAGSATISGALSAQIATISGNATINGTLSAPTINGNTYINGNVGIGTNPTANKLEVSGTIRSHEVKVCLSQGCDYVFNDDYKLMNLKDLNNFIKVNKHLPDVAPAAEMEAEGINLSEMNALLLRKIEELTLYVIGQQEQIQELQKSLLEMGSKKGGE